MFNNPGTKIQKWAKVIFWISVVGALILAFFAGFEVDDMVNPEHSFSLLKFIVTLAIYLPFCYLQALLLYAFGELADNSRKTAENIAKLAERQWAPALAIPKAVQPTINGAELAAEQSAAGLKAEEAPETEAVSKSRQNVRELLEYAIQFRSENGCRDCIKAKLKDMDESETALLVPITMYLEMPEPKGIKLAIAQLLSEMQ